MPLNTHAATFTLLGVAAVSAVAALPVQVSNPGESVHLLSVVSSSGAGSLSSSISTTVSGANATGHAGSATPTLLIAAVSTTSSGIVASLSVEGSSTASLGSVVGSSAVSPLPAVSGPPLVGVRGTSATASLSVTIGPVISLHGVAAGGFAQMFNVSGTTLTLKAIIPVSGEEQSYSMRGRIKPIVIKGDFTTS